MAEPGLGTIADFSPCSILSTYLTRLCNKNSANLLVHFIFRKRRPFPAAVFYPSHAPPAACKAAFPTVCPLITPQVPHTPSHCFVRKQPPLAPLTQTARRPIRLSPYPPVRARQSDRQTIHARNRRDRIRPSTSTIRSTARPTVKRFRRRSLRTSGPRRPTVAPRSRTPTSRIP